MSNKGKFQTQKKLNFFFASTKIFQTHEKNPFDYTHYIKTHFPSSSYNCMREEKIYFRDTKEPRRKRERDEKNIFYDECPFVLGLSRTLAKQASLLLITVVLMHIEKCI